MKLTSRPDGDAWTGLDPRIGCSGCFCVLSIETIEGEPACTYYCTLRLSDFFLTTCSQLVSSSSSYFLLEPCSSGRHPSRGLVVVRIAVSVRRVSLPLGDGHVLGRPGPDGPGCPPRPSPVDATREACERYFFARTLPAGSGFTVIIRTCRWEPDKQLGMGVHRIIHISDHKDTRFTQNGAADSPSSSQ